RPPPKLIAAPRSGGGGGCPNAPSITEQPVRQARGAVLVGVNLRFHALDGCARGIGMASESVTRHARIVPAERTRSYCVERVHRPADRVRRALSGGGALERHGAISASELRRIESLVGGGDHVVQ